MLVVCGREAPGEGAISRSWRKSRRGRHLSRARKCVYRFLVSGVEAMGDGATGVVSRSISPVFPGGGVTGVVSRSRSISSVFPGASLSTGFTATPPSDSSISISSSISSSSGFFTSGAASACISAPFLPPCGPFLSSSSGPVCAPAPPLPSS